jgi:hypothetical protein
VELIAVTVARIRPAALHICVPISLRKVNCEPPNRVAVNSYVLRCEHGGLD